MSGWRPGQRIGSLNPLNAWVSLTFTLIFLVGWRIGYGYHFFSSRPFWHFLQAVNLWAGVLGLAAIVLSMAFTLRRLEWIRRGSLRFWLRMHVWLGLIGPVLIEIHGYGKNFGLAGWSAVLMWATALSGFIGLYLRGYLAEDLKYRRALVPLLQAHIEELHHELAEHRVQLMEIQEEIALVCSGTGVARHERQVESGRLARDPRTVMLVTRDYLAYLFQTRRLRRRWKGSLAGERRVTRMIARHTTLTLDLEIRGRTSGFMNELFALWRLVHTPLSAAFAITVLTHLWTIWRY